MCVLKGGNYSLYEYISVIYAAVRVLLLLLLHVVELQSFRP